MHRFPRTTSRFVLLGSLCGVLLGACDAKMGRPGGNQDGEAAEEVEAPPAPVVLHTIALGDVASVLSSASTIEAEMQVTVHAEATGRVRSLSFEEGDLVQKGSLLARVQQDAQSLGLERATANYEKAEQDLERIKSLFARGAASEEELANARQALRSASIDRKDRSRDVANTQIRAPFEGTVTERTVSEGGFVSAGQQVLSLVDFSTLVARVYVPERELDRIRVGQPAQVVGKAAKGRQAEGTVKRIAPTVDAATGTVKITVALPAPSDGVVGFLPGMYAEVSLTTETRTGVPVIPKPALIHEDERTFVFLHKPGSGEEPDTVEKVPVETGLSAADVIEVRSGVEVGQVIVAAGQSGLKDGSKVEVVEGGTPASLVGAMDADAVAKEASRAEG